MSGPTWKKLRGPPNRIDGFLVTKHIRCDPDCDPNLLHDHRCHKVQEHERRPEPPLPMRVAFCIPLSFPKNHWWKPQFAQWGPRMSTGFDQEAQQWKARGKPKSMAVSWARFFLHGFGRRNFWNKFHRAACTVGYSWLFHISAIACCSTTTLYSCFFFHFFLSKRLIVTAWSMSTIWTNSS